MMPRSRCDGAFFYSIVFAFANHNSTQPELQNKFKPTLTGVNHNVVVRSQKLIEGGASDPLTIF
jgi:hypothetical protein